MSYHVNECILLLWRIVALGYSFLARVFLAAASLVQCAGAAAGTIEGAVTFPSPRVPSMTVYASDLDTLRVRTAQLPRGQTNFSLEVPPGRYLVFLAPNEPGAPDIYGAYTQFSQCASHDAGACEDHALLPVTVSARIPRAAVTIDDWYLTDDVAAQIDRIRGAAAGGARFEPEPLGAPRFSEYPSEPFETAAVPKIDFDPNDWPPEDRAILQAALLGGPNFAGHVTATLSSCGVTCAHVMLFDWRSGKIQELEPRPRAETQDALPCRPEETLLVRRDSRLLSVTRMRGAVVVTQYFVWNANSAALLQSGEYQRTSQTFCAFAAR
jgi:hypothetical protein